MFQIWLLNLEQKYKRYVLTTCTLRGSFLSKLCSVIILGITKTLSEKHGVKTVRLPMNSTLHHFYWESLAMLSQSWWTSSTDRSFECRRVWLNFAPAISHPHVFESHLEIQVLPLSHRYYTKKMAPSRTWSTCGHFWEVFCLLFCLYP